MSKLKVCVVTGSRADYGILYWIMKDLQDDPEIDLKIAVTGMHLSPEFGYTQKFIEADGFVADEVIETTLSSDTDTGVTKSIGLGVIGFADGFQRLKPDVVLLLGDRFEVFAAAQAALIGRITIAHIAGGDSTEGAFDEALRHSITKMAHLHFVTNSASARRVRQLGEDPEFIFNVGSPGLDYVRRMRLVSRSELENDLGIRFLRTILIVTFHPVTLEESSSAQFQAVLDAVGACLTGEVTIVFSLPNADTGGRALIKMTKDFASNHENVHVFSSLGHARYLSLIAHCNVVIGNSSSGLYEAPSFHKPTVDIGDRQKGRMRADSVIHCPPEKSAIVTAIEAALQKDCSQTVNPYGDGNSASRIIAELKNLRTRKPPIKKHFFDYE